MKSISRGGDDNEDRGGNGMVSDLVTDEIYRNDKNDDENANIDEEESKSHEKVAGFAGGSLNCTDSASAWDDNNASVPALSDSPE